LRGRVGYFLLPRAARSAHAASMPSPTTNQRPLGQAAGDAPGLPQLLRVPQVAQQLALSRSRVEQLVAAGEIRSLRIGRSRRIPIEALMEFIEARLGEASRP
jgi:excisionase family DNA binding protein